MKQVDLSADKRNEAGRNQSGKLRKEKKIPAVLYEQAGSNTLLILDEKQTDYLINKYGENVIVKLKINEREVPALIKEVQRDEVTRRLVHLDFQPVMLHEIIHAEVPILIINGERIEKNGWIINRQTSQIEVEGEVEKIPQHISIDASKLKLGDVLKVADLEISEELFVDTDINNIILSIKMHKDEPIDLVFDRTEPEVLNSPSGDKE